MMDSIDRRTVLAGGVAVCAGAALSACGGAKAATQVGTADAIGGAKPAPTAAAGTVGPAAAVPVGGGVVYPQQKVVVTQPTAGVYKAFSAVCTHQGCMVSEVTSSQIRCNCHGSAFSIKDGSVVSGPAPAPLKEEKVTESGGTLTLS